MLDKNTENRLVNGIVNYLAAWLDNEDANTSEYKSEEAINSYGCNRVIAAIRHLQCVVDFMNKEAIRWILREQCDFTEEEADYWYRRWINGEWE